MARVSGSPHTPSSRFIGEAFGVTAETGSSGTRATHYGHGSVRSSDVPHYMDPPAPPSAGPQSPVVADPPTPSAGLT